MNISGLQKLTLLDYPGHIACTVFTGGCNFRCPFCHNASLVLPDRERDELSTDSVLAFLKKRVGVLEGVAVTGGEPLLHSDIADFLREVKALGYKLKLDTNGSRPELLARLIGEGLVDRVAMDIKTAPEDYAVCVGLESVDISAIERSKDMLLSGCVDYEFRTTVVKGIHTEASLVSAAQWIAGAKEYYLQQYKDSGDLVNADGLVAFSEEEMCALCNAVKRFVPAAQLRGV